MDRHKLLLALKLVALLLGGFLVSRHFFGIGAGPATQNLFLSAAILMCVGLVLLADALIDDAALQGIAKFTGFAGLVGMTIATV